MQTRKSVWQILRIILILAVISTADAAFGAEKERFNGHFVGLTSDHRLLVARDDADGDQLPISLAGVSIPSPIRPQASAFLVDFLRQASLLVDVVAPGRAVVYISKGGKFYNVNKTLLVNGLALCKPEVGASGWGSFETQGRSKQLGLWSDALDVKKAEAGHAPTRAAMLTSMGPPARSMTFQGQSGIYVFDVYPTQNLTMVYRNGRLLQKTSEAPSLVKN